MLKTGDRVRMKRDVPLVGGGRFREGSVVKVLHVGRDGVGGWRVTVDNLVRKTNVAPADLLTMKKQPIRTEGWEDV